MASTCDSVVARSVVIACSRCSTTDAHPSSAGRPRRRELTERFGTTEPAIGQREVDRPQQQVDVAAAPVMEHTYPRWCRPTPTALPSCRQAAVLEPLLAGVDVAVDENAVEPSFQDRRRQVPPHRILQDDEIRLIERAISPPPRRAERSPLAEAWRCSDCTSNLS